MKSLKRKVYEIIETSDGDNKWSDRFDTAVITVISLNLVAIILESVEQLHHDYQAVFYYFELFSIIFFTTEYLLRLWTITENPRFARPVRGRLRFMLTPFALIDLVAILPFYLPAIVIDFRFLRMIRLFRVFRLLKVARYMRAITIISRVLREKKEEMVISVFAILFTLVLVSSFMFFIEHDAQPDKYTSIPATMWWGVATVTSVGYGDIYPITPWGKFLGSFVAILGLGLFALPTGIFASGFSDEISKLKAEERLSRKKLNELDAEPQPKKPDACPCCGRPFPKPEPSQEAQAMEPD